MTETEHLLDILIEECAEVIQRVTKAKRFGLYEVQPEQSLTNQERIVYELNDVIATANLLLCDMVWIDEKAIAAKREKIIHFLNYSAECGTLTLGPTTTA